MRMGAINEAGQECNTHVWFPGHAKQAWEIIEKLYAEAKEYLGGNFDFIVSTL